MTKMNVKLAVKQLFEMIVLICFACFAQFSHCIFVVKKQKNYLLEDKNRQRDFVVQPNPCLFV